MLHALEKESTYFNLVFNISKYNNNKNLLVFSVVHNASLFSISKCLHQSRACTAWPRSVSGSVMKSLLRVFDSDRLADTRFSLISQQIHLPYGRCMIVIFTITKHLKLRVSGNLTLQTIFFLNPNSITHD